MCVDEHWANVEGGRASVELVDGNIYLAALLRNVGNGIAVLQGWASPDHVQGVVAMPDPQSFRPQACDLYVPPGDVGFWQAGVRDPADPDYPALREAIEERRLFTIECRTAITRATRGRSGVSWWRQAAKGPPGAGASRSTGTSIGRTRADARSGKRAGQGSNLRPAA